MTEMTREELVAALDEAVERVVHRCMYGIGGALMSIPANPRRDVDVLLDQAARMLEADGWRPIDENTPRDGTEIDVFASGRRATDVHWDGEKWLKFDRFVRDKVQRSGEFTGTRRWAAIENPTYWMPPPEPPK